MRDKFQHRQQWMLILGALILLLACNTVRPTETPQEIVPSPTSTALAGGGNVPPTQSSTSQCDQLNGRFEMQVLVGPAEAVGLAPVAIGTIPFTVNDGIVQGGGTLTYEETLAQEWGTYTVYFDMDADVNGECLGEAGSESLDVTITASGTQLVEVRAEGFSGDYPWEGTHEMPLTFPIEEGASVSGEGWVFVLHLE